MANIFVSLLNVVMAAMQSLLLKQMMQYAQNFNCILMIILDNAPIIADSAMCIPNNMKLRQVH